LINDNKINFQKKFIVLIFLKFFFWLTFLLLSLSLISLATLQTGTFFDRVDLFFAFLALFGLFGLAYSKPFINVIFWRYFFYIAMIETFFYSIVLPLVGYQRYGKPFVFNGLYVFEIIYAVLLLYVIHAYAYRKPHIWIAKHL
jgi:hypothetical protein